MSVNLTVVYKAQVIVELTNETIENKNSDAGSEKFESDLATMLTNDFYKEVKIDPDYKRYGLDIGLVSENKQKLADACYDLANSIQGNPYLKDVFFEDFEA